ncbi:hypothetical protein NC651_036808 [Populus alba x Populus x berolinensis]|nr:hypothetical protein NC651_036808 [Populus alba x Populus x berolinensis]
MQVRIKYPCVTYPRGSDEVPLVFMEKSDNVCVRFNGKNYIAWEFPLETFLKADIYAEILEDDVLVLPLHVLDQQNDELINLTFKGVAQHFNEVFSELAQGGHGHLVMMKKKEELTSLHAKVIALEHDLHKSCQEASKNLDLCYQLENEYDVSGIPLDFLIQNMDSATPYIEPLSVRKLIVMANKDLVGIVRKVLNDFARLSRLVTNLAKSQAFLLGVDDELRAYLHILLVFNLRVSLIFTMLYIFN